MFTFFKTAAVATVLSLSAITAQGQDTSSTSISAEFPFEKSFVEVHGSQMAYVDEGAGPVVLFVHGNPTSSYLWRNVIPFIADDHRAIAVDLIGMGDSGKPDIDYTLQDHLTYLEGFVAALDLQDITLVLHDWGGGLGTYFAANHSENIRAVAMMEAAAPPVLPILNWDMLQPEVTRNLYKAMRDPVQGPKLLVERNFFVENIMQSAVIRPFTDAEMEAYRAPFATPDMRAPLLAWPNEVPIEGVPARNVDAMSQAHLWLTTSDQPKLVLYASPGWLVTPQVADIIAATYSNVETRFIGAGIHYVQEDQPEAIGRNISDWLRDRVD
ncbi:MAG: haloalkane dehalogenase [Pseudoruegeria sp.]